MVTTLVHQAINENEYITFLKKFYAQSLNRNLQTLVYDYLFSVLEGDAFHPLCSPKNWPEQGEGAFALSNPLSEFWKHANKLMADDFLKVISCLLFADRNESTFEIDYLLKGLKDEVEHVLSSKRFIRVLIVNPSPLMVGNWKSKCDSLIKNLKASCEIEGKIETTFLIPSFQYSEQLVKAYENYKTRNEIEFFHFSSYDSLSQEKLVFDFAVYVVRDDLEERLDESERLLEHIFSNSSEKILILPASKKGFLAVKTVLQSSIENNNLKSIVKLPTTLFMAEPKKRVQVTVSNDLSDDICDSDLIITEQKNKGYLYRVKLEEFKHITTQDFLKSQKWFEWRKISRNGGKKRNRATVFELTPEIKVYVVKKSAAQKKWTVSYRDFESQKIVVESQLTCEDGELENKVKDLVFSKKFFGKIRKSLEAKFIRVERTLSLGSLFFYYYNGLKFREDDLIIAREIFFHEGIRTISCDEESMMCSFRNQLELILSEQSFCNKRVRVIEIAKFFFRNSTYREFDLAPLQDLLSMYSQRMDSGFKKARKSLKKTSLTHEESKDYLNFLKLGYPLTNFETTLERFGKGKLHMLTTNLALFINFFYPEILLEELLALAWRDFRPRGRDYTVFIVKKILKGNIVYYGENDRRKCRPILLEPLFVHILSLYKEHLKLQLSLSKEGIEDCPIFPNLRNKIMGIQFLEPNSLSRSKRDLLSNCVNSSDDLTKNRGDLIRSNARLQILARGGITSGHLDFLAGNLPDSTRERYYIDFNHCYEVQRAAVARRRWIKSEFQELYSAEEKQCITIIDGKRKRNYKKKETETSGMELAIVLRKGERLQDVLEVYAQFGYTAEIICQEVQNEDLERLYLSY